MVLKNHHCNALEPGLNVLVLGHGSNARSVAVHAEEASLDLIARDPLPWSLSVKVELHGREVDLLESLGDQVGIPGD